MDMPDFLEDVFVNDYQETRHDYFIRKNKSEILENNISLPEIYQYIKKIDSKLDILLEKKNELNNSFFDDKEYKFKPFFDDIKHTSKKNITSVKNNKIKTEFVIYHLLNDKKNKTFYPFGNEKPPKGFSWGFDKIKFKYIYNNEIKEIVGRVNDDKIVFSYKNLLSINKFPVFIYYEN